MRSRASAVMLALALGACAGSAPIDGRPAAVADTPVKLGAPYEVRGRRYVPADTRDYDEVGLASWYGDEQSGVTASGERRDPRAISGAHPTLPLPSYVEVTSLATGRTIVVRINDRGPFVTGRIVDLSPAAARELGTGQGIARVRVRRVFPSEEERATLRTGQALPPRLPASPQLLAALNEKLAGSAMPAPRSSWTATDGRGTSPAPVPVRPASPCVPAKAGTRSGLPPSREHNKIVRDIDAAARPCPIATAGVSIQLGAFADPARAAALAAKVGGRVVVAGRLHLVRVGPFADTHAADEALAKLRARGYGDARAVRDAPPATHDLNPDQGPR